MAKIKKSMRGGENRADKNRPEGDSTEDDRTELGTQTQILDKFGQTSLRYHTKNSIINIDGEEHLYEN